MHFLDKIRIFSWLLHRVEHILAIWQTVYEKYQVCGNIDWMNLKSQKVHISNFFIQFCTTAESFPG